MGTQTKGQKAALAWGWTEDDLKRLANAWGWSESRAGGLMCSRHPTFGGIIDATIKTKEWFVVFNDDSLAAKEKDVWFPSRRDALFHAFGMMILHAQSKGLDVSPANIAA